MLQAQTQRCRTLPEKPRRSAQNNMRISADKTMEMFISFSKAARDIPLIEINNSVVQRVSTFTLLRCTISNQLSSAAMLTPCTPR